MSITPLLAGVAGEYFVAAELSLKKINDLNIQTFKVGKDRKYVY
jgi:hypothetical protein